MRRMWINQPSTLQPLHERHGQNVLAEDKIHGQNVMVWFISGEKPYLLVPTIVLSVGWREDKKN